MKVTLAILVIACGLVLASAHGTDSTWEVEAKYINNEYGQEKDHEIPNAMATDASGPCFQALIREKETVGLGEKVKDIPAKESVDKSRLAALSKDRDNVWNQSDKYFINEYGEGRAEAIKGAYGEHMKNFMLHNMRHGKSA
eukprot:GFYU01004909.1.p1 GENE.GFYU01004909.1~~GFYU01004909.1.p1  ORF type:complete len:148 (+),score=43.87 GFYU01004909.1:23-445(+)